MTIHAYYSDVTCYVTDEITVNKIYDNNNYAALRP